MTSQEKKYFATRQKRKLASRPRHGANAARPHQSTAIKHSSLLRPTQDIFPDPPNPQEHKMKEETSQAKPTPKPTAPRHHASDWKKRLYNLHKKRGKTISPAELIIDIAKELIPLKDSRAIDQRILLEWKTLIAELDKVNTLRPLFQEQSLTIATKFADQAMKTTLSDAPKKEKTMAFNQFQQQCKTMRDRDLMATLQNHDARTTELIIRNSIKAEDINSLLSFVTRFSADYTPDEVYTLCNKMNQMGLFQPDHSAYLFRLLNKVRALAMPAEFFLTALEITEHQQHLLGHDNDTPSDQNWHSLLHAIEDRSEHYTKSAYHISKSVDRPHSIDVLENDYIAFNTREPISKVGKYKQPCHTSLFAPHSKNYHKMVRFKFKDNEGNLSKGASREADAREELLKLYNIWVRRGLALRLPYIPGKEGDSGIEAEYKPRYIYAQGKPLYQHLQSNRLHYRQLLNMIMQVTEDLIHLKRPHRDINTENIIVVENTKGENKFVLNDVGTALQPFEIACSYTGVSINELCTRLIEDTLYTFTTDYFKMVENRYYFKWFLTDLFPNDPKQKKPKQPITPQLEQHFPAMTPLLKQCNQLNITDDKLFSYLKQYMNLDQSEKSAQTENPDPYFLLAAHRLLNTTQTRHNKILALLSTPKLTPEAIFQHCSNYFQQHFSLPTADRWRDDQTDETTQLGDIYALGLIAKPLARNAPPEFQALVERMLSPQLTERPSIQQFHDEIVDLRDIEKQEQEEEEEEEKEELVTSQQRLTL